MVTALNRKLLRDLRRLRGQVVSIALLVGCGVMAVVGMRSTYDSLRTALDEYYAHSRFGDVFATVTRAPESLVRRVRDIPGVAHVESRVVSEATLSVRGLDGPAVAHIVSVPSVGQPTLNRLHLFRGRAVAPDRSDEVIASVRFAAANRLTVGDTLSAVINGRWQRLRIVGVASSPDFIYEVAGGTVFVDASRFAVLWMRREALAAAAGMTGSFNDLSLVLERGGSEARVIAALDPLLAPYGGLGAIGRSLQPSNQVLVDELHQVNGTATVFPIFFLGIAAFLLNVVLSRLIATQRGEIGTLKAFGYSNRVVALHYFGFAAAAVALGSALGVLGGVWLGHAFTGLYDEYFGFPNLVHRTQWSTALIGIAVSGGAALAGAAFAVRSAASLGPAAAMRPEAPARFRRTLLERAGLGRLASAGTRMILRTLERRPLRTGASVLGIGLASAVLVAGLYPFDAVDRLIDVSFRQAQREDLAVVFSRPRSDAVRAELSAILGVARAELTRTTAARIGSRGAMRTVPLLGIDANSTMRRLTAMDGATHPLPGGGVVLASALARLLAVHAGDTVTVELMERGLTRRVVVSGVLDESIGLGVYMERRALNRLLNEGNVATGALIATRPGLRDSVTARLRDRPLVSAISSRLSLIEYFERTFADSVLLSGGIVIFAAVVIAIGVVYNGARISLSERARELASLRVLGFTRAEVSRLFLGEQAAITIAGLPLGAAVGLLFAALLALAFGSERHRFPVIVDGTTYLFSVGVVIATAAVVSFVVRRRLDRLDLIAVLKTED
jgi:putative ABC transport system permease protein